MAAVTAAASARREGYVMAVTCLQFLRSSSFLPASSLMPGLPWVQQTV